MTGGQILLFQLVFRKTHCLLAAVRAARTMDGGRRSATRRRHPPQPSVPLSAAGSRSPRPGDGEHALDHAIDALESEAVRRALSGVAIPVFHQGRECGNTVKHSDQLLMFLLKTLRPERYATQREETRGCAKTPPVELDIDLSAANENEEEGDDGGDGED